MWREANGQRSLLEVARRVAGHAYGRDIDPLAHLDDLRRILPDVATLARPDGGVVALWVDGVTPARG